MFLILEKVFYTLIGITFYWFFFTVFFVVGGPLFLIGFIYKIAKVCFEVGTETPPYLWGLIKPGK